LPGPAYFSTGLVDDPAFGQSSQAVRSLWLGRAEQIGSTAVRVGVVWAAVAPFRRPRGFRAANPSDRNYRWAALDATVRTATADGQTVVLMPFQAPSWAEGPGRPSYVFPGAWDPNPRDFGAFARALALRYSGHYRDPLHRRQMLPRVRYFQPWNEANLPQYLMPQWVAGPGGSIVAESPGLYRSMLNAFYSAVTAVQPSAYVLAAGTAPYGDPPGVDRMSPIAFLEGLMCLTPALRASPCPDPPHFDALDHHPYAIAPTVPAHKSGDVSVPDLGKIWRVLHAAQRVGHALPAGPKSLWVTELSWPTDPPNAVTEARQAHYLPEAFYELWIQHVQNVFWFQLRDPPASRNSFGGAGLYFGNGTAKPAATAFRFPFVALPVPHRKNVLALWGKAPTAGVVTIEELTRGSWRPILALQSTPGGIFYARRGLSPRLQLRAQIGQATSPAWTNPVS
jgi:hypothetical protein